MVGRTCVEKGRGEGTHVRGEGTHVHGCGGGAYADEMGWRVEKAGGRVGYEGEEGEMGVRRRGVVTFKL